MRNSFRFICRMLGILACAATVPIAQQAMAQAMNSKQNTAQTTGFSQLQSAQSFRTSFAALMDGYDQVFRQEGNLRGQQMVARAKAAMSAVNDADLAQAFSKSGSAPDMAPAVEAMQRVAALSQKGVPQQTSRRQVQSLPFPNAPPVIDDCVNTPHGDQITYDALIAFQVTSGILAAAAWVCNEDILGENGSAACIPLAIANDIASSLFAVRSFCSGLDTAATVLGNYDRLDHIHTDLANARDDIINNANANTTALTNAVNASATSIINNGNANTASIITNENANRDMMISQLQALGCEIIRLLNTPDGLKASSILACKAQPGFPYSWNKH